MRKLYIFAVIVFAACGAITSNAQPGATVPAAKIAIVDTEAFGDSKSGVKRLVAAFGQINREFQPKMDELKGLQARYGALTKTLNDTYGTSSPEVNEKRSNELEALNRDIKYKQEDGQKALDARTKELTTPILTDINTKLEAYAKERGFDMVFDISKFSGAVMFINQGLDITSAFITEYNTKNPVVPAGVPVKQQ